MGKHPGALDLPDARGEHYEVRLFSPGREREDKDRFDVLAEPGLFIQRLPGWVSHSGGLEKED